MKFISLFIWIVALIFGFIVASHTIGLGAHSKITIEQQDQNIKEISTYLIDKKIDAINTKAIEKAAEYLKGIIMKLNSIYGDSFKLFIILLIGTLFESLRIMLARKKSTNQKENPESI